MEGEEPSLLSQDCAAYRQATDFYDQDSLFRLECSSSIKRAWDNLAARHSAFRERTCRIELIETIFAERSRSRVRPGLDVDSIATENDKLVMLDNLEDIIEFFRRVSSRAQFGLSYKDARAVEFPGKLRRCVRDLQWAYDFIDNSIVECEAVKVDRARSRKSQPDLLFSMALCDWLNERTGRPHYQFVSQLTCALYRKLHSPASLAAAWRRHRLRRSDGVHRFRQAFGELPAAR